MDPISVAALTALLNKVFDGVTEEAGGRIFSSLLDLVRRARRADGLPAVAAAEQLVALRDRRSAPALADLLTSAAAIDPALDQDLNAWVSSVEALLINRPVTNSVAGSVHGKVVQAGDIGTLNF